MMKKNLFSILFVVPLLLIFAFGDELVYANGTERVFVSGYGQVTAIDPSTPEVIANIKVKGPVRDMSFTEDGKKGLVLANNRITMYVIDTVNNKVIDEIQLQGRTEKGLLDRRVWGSTISPDGKKAYAFVTQSEKRQNIFKTLPSKIIEIDLETKEELRSVEAPYGTHVLQFKEGDPNTIFVWGYDLYELDLKEMELSLKKGIKHPENESDGSGNYLMLFPRVERGFNSLPLTKEYPDGSVTEGIMWLNLKSGEFKTVEYDREPIGMFSAVIDNDEKYAYSVLNSWYKVELETGKVVKESKPPVGSTYGINLSLDGSKIYLGGAGNHFVVANTELEVEKVIELPTDGLDVRVVQIAD